MQLEELREYKSQARVEAGREKGKEKENERQVQREPGSPIYKVHPFEYR